MNVDLTIEEIDFLSVALKSVVGKKRGLKDIILKKFQNAVQITELGNKIKEKKSSENSLKSPKDEMQIGDLVVFDYCWNTPMYDKPRKCWGFISSFDYPGAPRFGLGKTVDGTIYGNWAPSVCKYKFADALETEEIFNEILQWITNNPYYTIEILRLKLPEWAYNRIAKK